MSAGDVYFPAFPLMCWVCAGLSSGGLKCTVEWEDCSGPMSPRGRTCLCQSCSPASLVGETVSRTAQETTVTRQHGAVESPPLSAGQTA